MTTNKTFDRLFTKSPEFASAIGTSEDIVRKVLQVAKTDIISRRRQPAPPPPEGGISIRAAGKKYKIPFQTISRWVKRGFIKTLLRTNNEVYISEKDIKKIAGKFSLSRGRGNRTIIKEFKRNETVVVS